LAKCGGIREAGKGTFAAFPGEEGGKEEEGKEVYSRNSSYRRKT